MKKFNHFIQFIFVILFFSIFKILGYNFSRKLSGYIFLIIGPFFRSKKIILKNLDIAFPYKNFKEKNKILKDMWFNYGQIFSEYIFIKNFKNSEKFNQKINVLNDEILEKIKIENKPVIFISGHFSNFELMAQYIEKKGINLAAVYRPLNNIFLNPLMVKIRSKFICKNQVKKGISGTKTLLKFFKKNNSIALMIDQRVSEGISAEFFNKKAFTTTIPAQFVKKFGAKIVPIYIERTKENKFIITINEPLVFQNSDDINKITTSLNQILENMIKKNPEQWIWTHDRWK
ncbi:lysophospholipid acyltransferase family protein [Candidatus Pelagibacter communis]|uniref:lysophospholipid acyltransferase family protein n=1 Tax=Candidatus Pelagibacter TaxID=198251 RepID=UPI003EE2BB91